jgi:hypothetical protein
MDAPIVHAFKKIEILGHPTNRLIKIETSTH